MKNISLLLGLLFLFVACKNDLKEIQNIVDASEVNIEKATNVKIYHSDSAKVKVYIEAPSMKKYMDIRAAKNEFDQGIAVDFYDDNLNVAGRLTAKYAIQLENKDNIIARDSVVLKSAAGDLLETEELQYNEKTQKITSTKLVTIVRKGEKIWGYGFESNTDFSEWKIFSPIGKIKTP